MVNTCKKKKKKLNLPKHAKDDVDVGRGNAGRIDETSNTRRCLEMRVSKRKKKKEKHLQGRHRGVKTSKSDLDV